MFRTLLCFYYTVSRAFIGLNEPMSRDRVSILAKRDPRSAYRETYYRSAIASSQRLDSTNARTLAWPCPPTGPAISGHRYNTVVRVVDRHVEMQLIISRKREKEAVNAAPCHGMRLNHPKDLPAFELSSSASRLAPLLLPHPFCLTSRYSQPGYHVTRSSKITIVFSY